LPHGFALFSLTEPSLFIYDESYLRLEIHHSQRSGRSGIGPYLFIIYSTLSPKMHQLWNGRL